MAEGSTDLSFVKCDLYELPCSATTDGSLATSGCPSINLSTNGNGAYGLSPGRVCLAATFDSDGATVHSASTELTFDSSKFAIESCYHSEGVYDPMNDGLTPAVLGPGHVRITVDGGGSPIPDGTLYVCTFTVVTGVANGPYTVVSVPSTTDASAMPLPTTGSNGIMNITSCAADCNGSGAPNAVRINEVGRASALFLGGPPNSPLCNPVNPALSCPNADMVLTNGTVTINEVGRASCLFLAGTCSKTCP
jgi:hypothetical protein